MPSATLRRAQRAILPCLFHNHLGQPFTQHLGELVWQTSLTTFRRTYWQTSLTTFRRTYWQTSLTTFRRTYWQTFYTTFRRTYWQTFYTTFRRTDLTNLFDICVIDIIYAFGYAKASEATMHSIAHSGGMGGHPGFINICILFATAYMQLDLSRIE
jgi:hypothetical protein